MCIFFFTNQEPFLTFENVTPGMEIRNPQWFQREVTNHTCDAKIIYASHVCDILVILT